MHSLFPLQQWRASVGTAATRCRCLRQELPEALETQSWLRRWAAGLAAFCTGGSKAQFVLADASAELERLVGLPKQLDDFRKALTALAPRDPFTVPFKDWEYYQPPEAVLERTLRLLVDADAAQVVVMAGMFGISKSSLARHIASNPEKLQKVNLKFLLPKLLKFCMSCWRQTALHRRRIWSQTLALSARAWRVHCGFSCAGDSAVEEKQKEVYEEISAKVCLMLSSRVFAVAVPLHWGWNASTDYIYYNLCSRNGIQAATCGDTRSALHKELRGSDCLIVLDDVWDSKVVSAFHFPGFCGKLLVTTRDENLGAASGQVVNICPSDCTDLAEPLLVSLAFRGTSGAVSLPADFQMSLQ